MSNKLVRLPKLPSVKTVNRCACGCGQLGPGRFRPGHDSKLFSAAKLITAGAWVEGGSPAEQLDAMADWIEANDNIRPVERTAATAAYLGIKWTRKVKKEEKAS